MSKYSKLYQDYLNKTNNLTPVRESVGITLWGMLIIITAILTITLTSKVVYAMINKPEVKKKGAEIVIVSNEHITEEEIKEAQARCDEWLRRENALSPQREFEERCKELNSNFQIGDWIKITWWGDNAYGPVAPNDASCTGQIQRIIGDKVIGTWGDYELEYKKAAFQRISHKEYLDLREKEQKIKDRKARAKKRTSWGLHPATTH